MFTAFAVRSLAAGVAVTTAVYSVVDRLLFTRFEAPQPESIAFVMSPRGGVLRRATLSAEDLAGLRASQRSFARVSGAVALPAPVSSTRNSEIVTVEAVDGEYFGTIGVSPAIGRLFNGDDDRLASRVAVVNEECWRTRFAAEAGALTRTLTINGQAFDIAGVVQGAYSGLDAGGFGTKVWIPLSSAPTLQVARRLFVSAEPGLTIVGWLANGVSHATAAAEVETLARQFNASRPLSSPAPNLPPRLRQWTTRSALDIDDEVEGVRRLGVILIILVALVLVVACTNLANLVLARGTARQGELEIRMAMGASRGRLIWEQCVEGLLLSALGAVAAYVMFVGLSAWMTQDFTILMPPVGRMTLSIRPEISAEAFMVSVIALIVSLGVFGLEPAVQLARSLDIRTVLAVGATGVRPRVGRQRMIIRWQVAVAAGFFIVATMFIRATIERTRHDAGVDIAPLSITTFNFQSPEWSDARIRRAMEQLVEIAAADPSVASLSGYRCGGVGSLDDRGCTCSHRRRCVVRAVSPGRARVSRRSDHGAAL